jgi:hypothetical protein
MGWEFAALWVEDSDEQWHWVWRRRADDTGAALQESASFAQLDDCIEDARRHGFDEGDSGSIV